MLIRTRIITASIVALSLVAIVSGCANNQTVLHKRDALLIEAEKGDAEAQYQLGRTYCCGMGGGYDEVTARSWFCKAALQGHGGAQYQLGRMLGERMDSDSTPSKRQFLIESYMWYSLAAKQNITLADAERNALANDLSAQEISEARARMDRWKTLGCR